MSESDHQAGSPLQHHLAALAAPHHLEGGFELGGGQAVGDHLPHVEAAFEHRQHLVPGLEHLAAVDPLHRDLVEDDLVEVERRRLRRDAEERDACDPIPLRGV